MFNHLRFQRHNFAIVALLCALCFSNARAQNVPTAGAIAGRDMAPVVGAVPIPVTADQLKGAPLFWATGITDVNDLPAYKSVGLNTVVVRLKWNPNTDANNLAALDVAPQRDFAEAAARTGLKVIYALPPTPNGMEFQMRIAGDSPSYNGLWTAWASAAIATLRDTPNLTGWMLPDDPRSLPIFSDEAFRRWIGRNYASIGILNVQWGTAYRDLNQVRMEDVADLANRNVGGIAGYGDEALGPLGTRAQPTIQNPAFHPAQLALAAYRWEAYRELLVTWIGVVRGADSNHLLFSGEMPDYAQMLSMPAGVDVMMPARAPDLAENDIVTHNPQAIDIARRGGRFAVMPVLTMRGTGSVPQEALPELSKRWLQEACARGASGLGFDAWPDLKNDLDLRQSLLEKLRDLNKAPFATLWGEPPVATTAVVLTPLADGVTIGYGPIAQGGRRGLFGWAEDLVAGEPSNLVSALRWGTAFGSVDYLAPQDLDGNLDIYNTILAPQMLSCSLDNQTALTNYVTGGGVLVADLGLGALQSGGQVGDLPPAMKLLFGVPGNYSVRTIGFNLQAGLPHELFPMWNRMMQIRPGVTLTRGDAGINAFAGPTGFSLVNPVADVIGIGPQIESPLNNGRPSLLRAPLTANSAGRGVAIWAPFRMWNYWRPGYTGFEEFHGDLMARGATLAISKNSLGVVDDVVPVTAKIPQGVTRFPEIINRAGNVTFLDHDAPGQPTQLASIETTGVGDWLWSGGITQLPNAQGVALTGGRPAPIDNPSAFESRTRPMSLLTAMENGEMTTMRMEPVSAQNLGGGPLCGRVISNTRAGADIYVWPNAASVMPDTTLQTWQPVPTIAAKFRLTVYSSPTGVNWAPGTRVRASVTSVTQSKKGDKLQTSNDQVFAVVDARGRATWELEGVAVRVQVAGG